MSDRFTYHRRSPIRAVKWDGVDRQSILDFVQEVLIEEFGWEYESPEDVIRFTDDDGYDPVDDQTPMVIFEDGTEVDPNYWIVADGDKEILTVQYDGTFVHDFVKS